MVVLKKILFYIGLLHCSYLLIAMELHQQVKKGSLVKHVFDKQLNGDVSKIISVLFFNTAIVPHVEQYIPTKKFNCATEEIAFFSKQHISGLMALVTIKNKIDQGRRPAITRKSFQMQTALPGALRRKILGNALVKVDVMRPWYCLSDEDKEDIFSLGLAGGAILGVAGISCFVDKELGGNLLLEKFIIPAASCVGSAIVLSALGTYANVIVKNSETQQYDERTL
jgi:hypothetical protein